MPVSALRRGLCGAALLLLVAPAPAAVLEGRVIHVADGDTLTVLDQHHRRHKVRLAGIDAPERGQAWGGRAAEELAARAKHRQVTVQWEKIDRYQRIIGVVRVTTPGCAICKPGPDLGLTLVGDGLAWHYRAYEREQTAAERQDYQQAETGARAQHAGLWADTAPVPPWDWRRVRKSAAPAHR